MLLLYVLASDREAVRPCSCAFVRPSVRALKIVENATPPTPLLKPLSHQTAMPQRLYSELKPCQRAVGSPRNTPKNIKFVSYSVYTTSSQRPYSVHTTFPQRLYSVHDVFTARKQLLQRVHSAHTASSWRLKCLRFYTYF